MSWTATSVTQTQQRWTVTAQSTSGESAELQYATEAQARFIAAVLELKPTSLPKQAIVRSLAQLPASPVPARSSRARR
ncbi:MAG: hypothetical protein U0228_31750 [Myxococcaceae bacterium]